MAAGGHGADLFSTGRCLGSPLMDFANELKNRLGQITKLETL
jgi:hypothetical protein